MCRGSSHAGQEKKLCHSESRHVCLRLTRQNKHDLDLFTAEKALWTPFKVERTHCERRSQCVPGDPVTRCFFLALLLWKSRTPLHPEDSEKLSNLAIVTSVGALLPRLDATADPFYDFWGSWNSNVMLKRRIATSLRKARQAQNVMPTNHRNRPWSFLRMASFEEAYNIFVLTGPVLKALNGCPPQPSACTRRLYLSDVQRELNKSRIWNSRTGRSRRVANDTPKYS